MRKGEIAGIVTEKERLDIVQTATAGGGITDVAHGHGALQSREICLVEYFRHKTFAFDASEIPVIIDGNDTAAFLAPVLERMESIIDQIGGIRNPINSEDAAFLAKEIG